MRKVLAGLFVSCVLMLLAGCATAALESQSKVQDRRQARVYIMRESTLIYSMGVAPVLKVNGQEVGRVANGSYFFVDRPPGTYTVTLETPLTPGRFKADVTLRPGATYYVKIAPRAEHLVIGLAVGMAGQIFEAAVAENSGAFSVTALDQATGAAMLKELKKGS
jgi:hypothetical protein